MGNRPNVKIKRQIVMSDVFWGHVTPFSRCIIMLVLDDDGFISTH